MIEQAITYHEALQLLHADGYRYITSGGFVQYLPDMFPLNESQGGNDLAWYEVERDSDGTARIVDNLSGGELHKAAHDLDQLPPENLQANHTTATTATCPLCATVRQVSAGTPDIVTCGECPTIYRVREGDHICTS